MSNAMWGGRFTSSPDSIMEEINASIDFDQRLAAQDIAGSKAHAAMLAATGIITAEDASSIQDGLDRIGGEIEAGTFTFSRALEDIHMNIESRLATLIGDAAGRLHTARSRNDQVALDFRLWIRETLGALDHALRDLQVALTEKAFSHADAVMPGFTHLQSAQPVTLGHHLMAYVEMIGRDRGRFADARRRLNESPLGAAALAGTSFPIDRQAVAVALGFERPTACRIAISLWRRSRLQRSAPCTCRGSPRRSCSGRPRSSASRPCRTSSRPGPPSCRKSATRTRRNWSAARPAASSVLSWGC